MSGLDYQNTKERNMFNFLKTDLTNRNPVALAVSIQSLDWFMVDSLADSGSIESISVCWIMILLRKIPIRKLSEVERLSFHSTLGNASVSSQPIDNLI